MSVHVTGTLNVVFGSAEEMQRAGQTVETNPALTIVSVDVDNLQIIVDLDLTTEV